ncbi:hypothetical protein CAAN1_20S02476 [[Candida] anglica]|uniref:Uncharacterized protein n=1 Tax=[Candida] anglica TaxID=148631 RepID=A0ABP0EFJ6_9ASCO
MSLITSSQTQVIENSISSYIENYDRIAQQYLTLRQNILTLFNGENNSNSETQLKAQKYKYELEKVREAYTLHVEALVTQLDIHEQVPSTHTIELDQTHDTLQETKIRLNDQIKNLTTVQKPLLDDLGKLLVEFESGLNTKRRPGTKPNAAKQMNGTVNDKENSYNEQLLFGYDELKALATSVDGVDLHKYLDEHLDGGKTFRRLADNKYVYNASRSSVQEKATTTVAEYDEMIRAVIHSIGELEATGAEARDRWSVNALRLDVIKEALMDENF